MLMGKVIERHRAAAGITQAAMAQVLGITQSAYSRLEKGASAMNLAQLRVVSTHLGQSPGEVTREADQLAGRLKSQGVEVKDDKGIPPAAILVGLGILLALLAASK
jgi:transcriptional regulator with XRE-family HTH domain